MTRQPSGARQTGHDSPQEAEASSGHDEESGALTGSLSNRFHFCDRRGRRLGLASMATTRGTACPRRVSADKTRHGKFKMFLWAQQDINTALLAGTCGLDPRGLSQRRAGGLGWAADGGVISRERRAWVSRGRLAWSPANGGLGEPRTAAWTPANGGLEREDEWRLPCREGQNRQAGTKQKTLKNEKQNDVKGRHLLFRSGLLSQCTQQGDTRNTQTRRKLK